MSDIQTNDIPVNIEDIMHTAYLQYSLSVNVGRAIPDVRDGLKPGNRRILYAMHQLGLTKGHSFTKSAKVVGEVIGNYHPHGDSSVYDTLVRMAQDFAMRAPLIDGQGNFGSIDGDPPAAYRYTECRMERLAEELLSDISKRTVDMLPTFDESTLEPTVLPARFPNLLVNGTTGIGVGMASNIPPHNLAEVINATICLMDNPSASISDLMVHLPGPDFPTGAIIRGLTEIRRLYETGRGVLRIRAKAEIEDKDGKERIIVTEIPYAVNKENLVKKIADLVNEKKLTGIAALRDETSRRTGIRIVIDVKRNAMASVVLNQLYAHTSLENAFGCVMMVVDGKRPRVMNLRMILQSYIDHRLEVVTRRTKFELEKAEARLHVLEGLLIAVANIDEVVRIIRESRNREEAAAALKSKFNLSDIQTAAILDMRLHQLTGLAIETLEAEHRDVSDLVRRLRELLSSREALLGVVKDELIEVRDKYGDERRTELTIDDSDINIADLIPRHSCVITVTNTGYVKRVPTAEFRTQHRGGKGVIGMETKEEDYVEHLFNADSHDIIFFITNRGVMHWLNVYEIPEGARTGKGKAIVNMVKVQPGESIRAMLTVSKEDLERDDLFLTMATKNGLVKKTALSAFKNLRRAGIIALRIRDEDDLVEAAVMKLGDEIILSTAKGLACRFSESEVRAVGRVASGVTGVRFKIEGDYVVGMAVVPPVGEDSNDDDESGSGPVLLVVTNGGMGKRTYVSKYRKTRRGAKGVVNIKLAEGESVVSALLVEPDDELIITTVAAQTVRIPVDEVRLVGRASKGVKIMRFKKKGDEITGVAKVVKVEPEKNGDDSAESADSDAAEAGDATAVGETASAASADAPKEEAKAPESATDGGSEAEKKDDDGDSLPLFD